MAEQGNNLTLIRKGGEMHVIVKVCHIKSSEAGPGNMIFICMSPGHRFDRINVCWVRLTLLGKIESHNTIHKEKEYTKIYI